MLDAANSFQIVCELLLRLLVHLALALDLTVGHAPHIVDVVIMHQVVERVDELLVVAASSS